MRERKRSWSLRGGGQKGAGTDSALVEITYKRAREREHLDKSSWVVGEWLTRATFERRQSELGVSTCESCLETRAWNVCYSISLPHISASCRLQVNNFFTYILW